MLKPSKCELFRKQINYLGHVAGHNRVSTDPKKIEAVTEWPRPITVTEVRSFLGLVSYYRRFIPNFSKLATALNKLLQNLEGTSNQKKKFKVHWGPEQQEAFETLQMICTEAPALAYADFKSPFILHTDASGDGLGAVLYQDQDGQRTVVAYHKLKFLALKWAITDKFHKYLYGAEFQVFKTKPLNLCSDNSKGGLLPCPTTTCSITYKPGKANRDADALSRIK